MKTKLFFSLLVGFMIVFAPQAQAFAPTSEMAETTVQKKSLKENVTHYFKQKKTNGKQRIAKFIQKKNKLVAKVIEKLDIDLQDDVMKWLWYALIAWLASILLYILAAFVLSVLSWIAAIASLAGTVCFVIWLLKYLEIA